MDDQAVFRVDLGNVIQFRREAMGALMAAALGGRVGHAAGAARGAARCLESAVRLGRGRLHV
eukprot:1503642-Alexandrium_andersonii.AAC.1